MLYEARENGFPSVLVLFSLWYNFYIIYFIFFYD